MSDFAPRVLFVTTSFPLYENHWSGVFIAVQARALARLGCKMTVLAPDAPGAKPREDFGPIEVYRFRYLPDAAEKLAYGGGIPANLQASPWLWATVAPFAGGLFWSLSRLARQADIVHTHWSFAGAIASMVPAVGKRPLVASFHGSDLAKDSGPMNHAARRVCQSANAIVVHSEDMRQRAIRLGAVDGDTLLIPHGVETNTFSLARHGKRKAIRLVAVGRLSEEKGFSILLDALSSLPENISWQMQIIGEGPLASVLQNHIDTVGLHQKVTLSGALPPSQVKEQLAQSDIMVIPSFREGFGVVALEAMATGLPIVGTEVGGLPEVVEEGSSGLLVTPGNSQALAAAIEQLATDVAQRRSMGKAGLLRVKTKYDADVVNRPLVDLYRRLLR